MGSSVAGGGVVGIDDGDDAGDVGGDEGDGDGDDDGVVGAVEGSDADVEEETGSLLSCSGDSSMDDNRFCRSLGRTEDSFFLKKKSLSLCFS